ncbi:hypothetical protein LTR53_000763, partial [Teratosphaeriaceae sp. CCFEE 6253]
MESSDDHSHAGVNAAHRLVCGIVSSNSVLKTPRRLIRSMGRSWANESSEARKDRTRRIRSQTSWNASEVSPQSEPWRQEAPYCSADTRLVNGDRSWRVLGPSGTGETSCFTHRQIAQKEASSRWKRHGPVGPEGGRCRGSKRDRSTQLSVPAHKQANGDRLSTQPSCCKLET